MTSWHECDMRCCCPILMTLVGGPSSHGLMCHLHLADTQSHLVKITENVSFHGACICDMKLYWGFKDALHVDDKVLNQVHLSIHYVTLCLIKLYLVTQLTTYLDICCSFPDQLPSCLAGAKDMKHHWKLQNELDFNFNCCFGHLYCVRTLPGGVL